MHKEVQHVFPLWSCNSVSIVFYLSTNTIKYLKHTIIVLLKYVCYCLIQYPYNEVSSTEALQNIFITHKWFPFPFRIDGVEEVGHLF